MSGDLIVKADWDKTIVNNIIVTAEDTSCFCTIRKQNVSRLNGNQRQLRHKNLVLKKAKEKLFWNFVSWSIVNYELIPQG